MQRLWWRGERWNSFPLRLTPERVVHAKGSGALGHFLVTHAIERGDFPSWKVKIQGMPEAEIDKLSFDPFALLKGRPCFYDMKG